MDAISRALSLAWEVSRWPTSGKFNACSDCSMDMGLDASHDWDSRNASELDSDKSSSEDPEHPAELPHQKLHAGSVHVLPGRPAHRSTPASVACCDEQAVVIFDWDNTLLPTWYIRSVVEPASTREAEPPPGSAFLRPLRRHAQLIAATLRATRAVGRVAIVTLSMRPWVHTSAAQFLPGLDLQGLLDELCIPIYYASEHVHTTIGRLARREKFVEQHLRDGIDVLSACKRGAMSVSLRKVCGRKRLRLNVLSVGDSAVEHKAIKDVLWSPRPSRLPKEEHLCKTVKLIEEPTLQRLGDQLTLFTYTLPSIIAHRDDVDLNMAVAAEEELLLSRTRPPSATYDRECQVALKTGVYHWTSRDEMAAAQVRL